MGQRSGEAVSGESAAACDVTPKPTGCACPFPNGHHKHWCPLHPKRMRKFKRSKGRLIQSKPDDWKSALAEATEELAGESVAPATVVQLHPVPSAEPEQSTKQKPQAAPRRGVSAVACPGCHEELTIFTMGAHGRTCQPFKIYLKDRKEKEKKMPFLDKE